MMLFLFTLLIIGHAFASVHEMTINFLSNNQVCGNQSLTSRLLQEVQETTDMERFDRFTAIMINHSVKEQNTTHEALLEAIFVFLADEHSPLCGYMQNQKLIWQNIDWPSLQHSIERAFKENILLKSFATGILGSNNGRVYYELYGKQVELAKVFLHFCKHPISSLMLFKVVLERIVTAHPSVFSCPQLSKKLNNLFNSNDYKAMIKSFENSNLPVPNVFTAYILHDKQLMNEIYDRMMTVKELELEDEFRCFVLDTLTKSRLNTFLIVQFVTYMTNYDFSFDKMKQFLSPVFDSSDAVEWSQFFRVFTYPLMFKGMEHHLFDIDAMQVIFKNYCSYLPKIFDDPNPKQVAKNLIIHLRRANAFLYFEALASSVPSVTTAERFIKMIADAYDIDLESIEYEFPKEFKITHENYLDNIHYLEKMHQLMAEN